MDLTPFTHRVISIILTIEPIVQFHSRPTINFVNPEAVPAANPFSRTLSDPMAEAFASGTVAVESAAKSVMAREEVEPFEELIRSGKESGVDVVVAC